MIVGRTARGYQGGECTPTLLTLSSSTGGAGPAASRIAMRTGIREGAEWENHILQQAEDPAVIIQDSWRGCHREPQHQHPEAAHCPDNRFRPRNEPHCHTSPHKTANCRKLPHIAAQNCNKQGQARGGKCDTRDGKCHSRNGAHGDEHQ